jgi:colanic acid/amylovoran biosynthesis protein
MITVISTVYNGEQYFDKAIPSILAQDYRDFEYIIVDDGSTDGTLKKLQELSKKDPRIRVFAPDRMGRAKALNFAVSKARGEYIAQQDFDDVSYTNRLSVQASFLDNYKDIGWIGCWYDVEDSISGQSFTRKVPLGHREIARYCARAIPFAHTLVMFRKKAWEKAGGYPLYDDIEDLRLCINIAKSGYRLANVGLPLGIHYVHQNSFWHTNFKYIDRQKNLSLAQKKAITDLHLPKWMYIYPLGRVIYSRLSPHIRTIVRRFIGGSKEQDSNKSNERAKAKGKEIEVIIAHIPNTYNYGSMMLATNFIYYFINSVNSHVTFYIDALTSNHVERLKLATGYNDIYVIPCRIKKKPKNKILRKIFAIYKNISDFKYFKNKPVVFLGGDDFCEVYGVGVYRLAHLFLASRKANITLFGQTIGPFYKWRKRFASNIMRRVKIYTRDKMSFRYLSDELNLKGSVTESRDLAFLSLPLQSEHEQKCKSILSSYDLIENEYITLVPSGLWHYYTSSYNKYIKFWFDIIKYLVLKYPNKKVVLLTHVHKSDTDSKIIREITKYLDNDTCQRIVPITQILLPVEARLILSKGIYTISGRMHAVISTIQTGKPAIALSYSPKYDGVLSEGMDIKELVIKGDNNELWQSINPYKSVCKKIENVEKNYGEITEKIKTNATKCASIVHEHVKEIAKAIEL